ncbi:MAG: GNAT family N-acetyltransferase [Microthrixaceae bacterium]
MTTPVTLLVRADGGPGVGYGHLGRTLALGEAWVRAGGEVDLCSDNVPAEWERRWRESGARLHGAASAPRLPADALAIDGYGISPTDLLRGHPSLPLLQIDDHGLSPGHGAASIIVDQNAGAQRSTYTDVESSVRLLLGARYLLLRAGTLAAAGAERAVRAGHVVVFLGGDPGREVADMVGMAADVLRTHGHTVEITNGHRDVPVAFGSAELAIVTAGSTTWDLALIGVPMIVIPVTDNQAPVADALANGGVASRVDPSEGPEALAAVATRLLRDPESLQSMAELGRALVDGMGSARVATALRSELVTLRPVERADAALLWEWANDPATRASSFDPRPIGWTEHCEWLDRKLRDDRTCMVLGAGPDGGAVGQLRVEVDGTKGLVGVTVAPERRGAGWAAPLIAAGARRAMTVLGGLDLQYLEARVRRENSRSSSAFLAADFDRSSDGCTADVTWHAYVWRGDQ